MDTQRGEKRKPASGEFGISKVTIGMEGERRCKNNSSQQSGGERETPQRPPHQRRPARGSRQAASNLIRPKLYGCVAAEAARPSLAPSLPLLLLLLAHFGAQLALAQCPWARDSTDLHSDCICDFNPQSIEQQRPQTTTTSATTASSNSSADQQQALRQQQVARRMSVQCAPVDFEQLLRALKQTASIELPLALARSSFAPGAELNSTMTRQPEEELEEDKSRFISQIKLDLLHVSNSSIAKLENDTFVMDTRQRIESIPSRHLVVAIQALHLSRCAISQIEPGAFNGLEWTLKSLSLTDNRLEEIPRAALERLASLRLLDLSNNRIKQIKSGTFLKLNKLHTLRLADNKQLGASLERADSSAAGVELGAFDGLEANLNDLSLKNTQLVEFPVAIKRLRALAFLNLAQNQIVQVPEGVFSQMSALTAINLERNRITKIEDDTFYGTESTLSSLSLLGNLIESLPARQLEHLQALRRLDLGFNRISSLPANSFSANKRLMLIALDGNPLETLPELAFRPLEGVLRGLSVGGKSLVCDCQLSWMLRWQIEHNLQITSRERAPQFCAKPAYLRSLVSFAALQPEHLTCSAQQQFGASTNTSSTSGLPESRYVYTTTLAVQPASGNGWTATSPVDSANNDIGRLAPLQTAGPTNKPTTWTTMEAQTSGSETAAFTVSPSVTIEYVNASGVVVASTSAPETTTQLLQTNSSVDLVGQASTLASTTEEDLGDEETDATELSGDAGAAATTSTSNQLGSLPEDELFAVAPTNEPDRRKSNRNGYLAPHDLLRYNKTPAAPSERQSVATLLPTAEPERPRTFSTPITTQRPAYGGFGERQQTNTLPPSYAARNETTRPMRFQPARVPAIPTTVNVYKAPPNQMRTSPAEAQATHWPTLKYEPPIAKGARSVEDGSSTTSAPTTFARKRTVTPTSSPTRTPALVDTELDLERFSQQAASSVRAQFSSHIPPGPQSLSVFTPQRPTLAVAQTTTTLARSTTARPPVTSAPTQPPPASQFNTRMSVSSMYRLATGSPRPQTTRKSQPPPNTSPATFSTSSTSTTTTTTTTSTTTTTTPAPTTTSTTSTTTPRPARELAPTSKHQPSEQPDRTTRMASTVRVVESPPEVKKGSFVTIHSNGGPSNVRQTTPQAFSPTIKAHNDDSPTARAATNNLISQAAHQETGRASTESEHRPMSTFGEVEQMRPSRPSIVAPEPDQARDQSRILRKEPTEANQRPSSSTDQQLDHSARSFARRLPKLLTDFDHIALVLAAILCVLIFLITLIIAICTCCSLRDQSNASGKSRSGARGHAQQAPENVSCLARFLCFCFSRGPARHPVQANSLTPVHALMMQDDVNSTSSSSGGGSSSQLVNGIAAKSLLLASATGGRRHKHQNRDHRQQQPHKSSLMKEKSLPLGLINHEASLRKSKQRADKEYFLRFSASKSRGGRRLARWTSEIELDNAGRHDGMGWLSDSCDSDKSCSPGANKNNRYNMNEAHQAYLAGKQIQASMFVSTAGGHKLPVGSNTIATSSGAETGPNKRYAMRCMGLLKTIEMGRLHRNHYTANSERSTDDSGAPLNGSPSRQQCDLMERHSPTSGHDARIDRSTSMLRRLPNDSHQAFGQNTVARCPQRPAHHLDMETPSTSYNAPAFPRPTDDLVPISAEEEWPEPYMEPLSNDAPLRPAYNDGPAEGMRSHSQDQDRQYEQFIHEPQMISNIPADVRSYDRAYLANWRTVSRSAESQCLQGGGVNWLRWSSADN